LTGRRPLTFFLADFAGLFPGPPIAAEAGKTLQAEPAMDNVLYVGLSRQM